MHFLIVCQWVDHHQFWCSITWVYQAKNTKKFNNLPSFQVLVNGNSKKYKVSYDFEKIKSAILTDGLNTILKKQKKIVINPKELKNLIDKNSNDLKPEKIIDFFLN